MCCKDRNGSNKGKPMKRRTTKPTREKKTNRREPSKQISGPPESPPVEVEEKKEVSYEIEMPVVTASTTEEASASQTTQHSPDNNTAKSFRLSTPKNKSPSTSHLLADHLMEDEELSES